MIFFTNIRTLGRITEDWFRDAAEAEGGRELRQGIKVRVYDWENWRSWWWWGHIQSCFPTYVGEAETA